MLILLVLPIVLTTWSLAAPIGSSPDDSFHLPSIWCTVEDDPERCAVNPERTEAVVPGLVAAASWCYAPLSDVSARCQDQFTDQRIAVQEWNTNGTGYLYPPLYYETMGLLVVDNPQTSILLMRALNALLLMTLVSGLILLAPMSVRQAVTVSITAVSVPLGLFLVSSNNPSSWAIIGVATFWAFALIGLEAAHRSTAAIAYTFAIAAAIIAAGARSDAAVYIAISSILVLLLGLRRGKPIRQVVLRVRAVPLLGIVTGCAAAFLAARQAGVAVGGFTGGTDYQSAGAGGTADRIGNIAANFDWERFFVYIRYVPEFIAGGFGGWGLGWLDTPMPAIVVWLSFPTAFALVIVGIGQMYRGKAIALPLALLAVIGIPTWIAVSGGHDPGTYLQPRYIYPLFFVVIGIALLATARSGHFRLSHPQWLTFAVALSVAHAFALHATIRRFATGNDLQVFNLNTAVEWWRESAPSPMAVWIIGSVGFAIIAVAAFSTFRKGSDASPTGELPVSSDSA